MGAVIGKFLQDDGIVVIDAGLASVSRSELASRLSALGCSEGHVMALRRLPGALALGYEVGADLVTRVWGKLVGEFFEALGRVVVGAEVLVNGVFEKPEGLVGPYFIVAVAGAEFGARAAQEEQDLVAVDLSASGIRTLPNFVFSGCTRLAAVAFPPELESIGGSCFSRCDGLHVINLGATQVERLGPYALSKCGVTQVLVPASLRQIGHKVFEYTPLRILDLSACDGISVDTPQPSSLVELSLPFDGFAAGAEAFLPGSKVEVLRGDVSEAEINALLPHLDEWGLDRMCVVSPRVEECVWQQARQSAPVEMTDPVAVTTPASVTMTAWRELPEEWKPLFRVIDLSGLALELLPRGATLKRLACLEGAVLPTGLRKLPQGFFSGCWRLSSIETRYTALEEIVVNACDGCRSLVAFAFPPTVRSLEYAFDGTSITTVDLSGTVVESVCIDGMPFLVELVLPRRCVLEDIQGIPSLRCVTLGHVRDPSYFAWHPTEVRFESLTADAVFSPGLLEARVYGEVGGELGRETLPFPPP
jgi:hypothetical protein